MNVMTLNARTLRSGSEECSGSEDDNANSRRFVGGTRRFIAWTSLAALYFVGAGLVTLLFYLMQFGGPH